MHDRNSSATPTVVSVEPMPKNPKRSTQANMAMSITRLIPNRFRKKGINRMQSASETCETETSRVGFSANQLFDVAAKLFI